MSITIIGLGPGDPGCLTRAAWDQLLATRVLYVRTAIHPTIIALPATTEVHSFDYLYEQAADFGSIYAQIAEKLVGLAATGDDIAYAVPGDPLTAEATTRRILALARERGIVVRVLSGVSFIEPVCAALELDPLERGLQLIDALDFIPALEHIDSALSAPSDSWASLHGYDYEPLLTPFPILANRPALICQIYNRRVASEVKLSLMERYPATHPVTLVRAAGVLGQERIWTVALHELDHHDDFDHLTSGYIPPLPILGDLRGPDGLHYIVMRLLAPNGCPWDREQTPQSLRSAILNEAHEVLEALDADDPHAISEELGDLLMNILSQAEMARQAGDFGPGDVYEQIATKLIRRHPHVFGDLAVGGSGEVLRNWEAIKQAERQEKGQQLRGTLDGIPPSLPALATAQELARKAARTGFAWPNPGDAWRKVHEEIAEVAAVSEDPNLADDERALRLEEEIGDLLLATAVVARTLGVDAETALRSSGARFKARFVTMERLIGQQGRSMAELSLAEALKLWETAKQALQDAEES
jgi:tetrapyrrole methylase family protein/MazG family protein